MNEILEIRQRRKRQDEEETQLFNSLAEVFEKEVADDTGETIATRGYTFGNDKEGEAITGSGVVLRMISDPRNPRRKALMMLTNRYDGAPLFALPISKNVGPKPKSQTTDEDQKGSE